MKPKQWITFHDDNGRPLAQITSRAWVEWHQEHGRRMPLPQGVREFIMARDGLMCGICGGAVERSDVHIDHVQPFSSGGSDDPSNLRVTHSLCNLRKGAKV